MLVPIRLLLSAEPFGFGPTAAIAAFFPYLQETFAEIGFVGEKHALDLQRSLPYRAIYDSAAMSEVELDAVVAGYDVVMVATDDGMALRAKRLGKKVIYYDPLVWYWPGVRSAFTEADLYLAQNFVGVEERLAEWRRQLGANVQVVAPIVPAEVPQRKPRHVLVNMGGLQNPYWSVGDAAVYAKNVLLALENVLPKGEVVVATSSAVAAKLPERFGARSLLPEEMCEALLGAKCAFMTPGLGNIYDAAHYGIPTLWLPPANDSQGQQLDLLRKDAVCEGWVDWGDLEARWAMKYKDPQPEVLEKITHAVRALDGDAVMQAQLVKGFADGFVELQKVERAAAGELLVRYGRGGAAQVAAAVVEFLKGLPRQ